jgi:oligo-1,6-glucosidase
MELDTDPNGSSKWDLKPWSLLDLKRTMSRWQYDLDGKGWNSLYLSNHDQPRALSRFGDDGQYRVESAKLLATFLHMLQGTPYIYQGEEIGMTNVEFPSIDDYRDIETLNMYRDFVGERGNDRAAVMASIYAKGRDNARTPMQWNGNANAGFTSGTPWIKVNPNYSEINVEQALADRDSIFYYYQQLIALRKANPIMAYGSYDLILPDHEQIYAFTRTLENKRLLVILNFSAATAEFVLPDDLSFHTNDLFMSNYKVDNTASIGHIHLRPYEARVYQLY